MINNISGEIALNDGHKMPGYGYGVYKAAGNELVDALACAFEYGYRYIDTASFYNNEKEVGTAIKNSGLAPERLFVVSKIWPTQFGDPVGALDKSLNLLGLEYLDGYLLHWPGLDERLRLKTWEKLLREQEKGKIRVLGVSNFLKCHLLELYENFHIWTPINQIEVHPRYQEKELRAFCGAHDIAVISWSPLGRGNAMEIPEIVAIARKVGKTSAQVILRWQIQGQLIPIPKSVHCKRILENADVFDFELDSEQMAAIDKLDLPNHAGRTGRDPLTWPPLD